MPRPIQPASPFRYFNSSPEIIRLVMMMMYVRFPLSLRIEEDLLAERGIDISHETVGYWWNRSGPIGEGRRQRSAGCTASGIGRWHLDVTYAKLNGEMVYLWQAVDHEGESSKATSP